MKSLITATALAALVSSAAFAGGPVVIADEGEPAVVTSKPSSGDWLPLLAGVVIICALACGGGDNNTTTTPEG